MSKEVRWTFYILITAGIIGFGWYMSLTERPDAYTPQDAPYTQTSEPAPASGEVPDFDDDGAGADPEAGEWTARIVGAVTGTHPMTSDGQELFSIELTYHREPDVGASGAPEISSPVNLVGSREMFEAKLGRLPQLHDRIVVETAATEPDPVVLPLRDIEFADDDH